MALRTTYIDNKYTRWYAALVEKARVRLSVVGPVEKHHVLPRSLGGGDGQDNIVVLTVREHFIAHAMLVRMTVGQDYHRMARALKFMLSNVDAVGHYKPKSSILFEAVRKLKPRASTETRKKMSKTRLGVKRPAGFGQKVGLAQTGKYVSPDVGQKIAAKLRSSYRVSTPAGKTFVTHDFKSLCKELGLRYDTIMRSFRANQPVLRGSSCGWQIMEKLS
jgi:hypothetical protein